MPNRTATKGPVKALVLLCLALPLLVVVGRFAWMRWDLHHAEVQAVAALAVAQPDPAAYGVLGTLRLDQGRVAEALPLLEKAAALEARSGQGTRASLSLAKAQLDGVDQGLPQASRAAAAQALRQAEALAQQGPAGLRAQTYFSAGLFWQRLGRKDLAIADLRSAVGLQKDDWVDRDQGQREKIPGLAVYYQKMLAAAEQD